MLAYEFFLPISAAGFGLGSGISHIWPNGLLVFFVHFAWATMFGIITLIAGLVGTGRLPNEISVAIVMFAFFGVGFVHTAFFAEHGRFGLPEDDIFLFCQGTMPAVDVAASGASKVNADMGLV